MGQLLDGTHFGLALFAHDHRCRYTNGTIGDLFSWPARWNAPYTCLMDATSV